MFFCKNGTKFLQELTRNNTRDWFQCHKADYDRLLKHPAEAFAISMAAALETKTGNPYIFKIFRIFRDVRFSKDKTPYNSHVRISFKTICNNDTPGYYFSLESDYLLLGAGVFSFQNKELEHYRNRVSGADGTRLQKILDTLEKRGVRLSEPELKRVPSAFASEHPNAELLRRKGMLAWIDLTDATLAYGDDAVENCLKELLILKPLLDWMTP